MYIEIIEELTLQLVCTRSKVKKQSCLGLHLTIAELVAEIKTGLKDHR